MKNFIIILCSIIVGIFSSSIEKEVSYFMSILIGFILSKPRLNEALLKLFIESIIFIPIILKLYNFSSI